MCSKPIKNRVQNRTFWALINWPETQLCFPITLKAQQTSTHACSIFFCSRTRNSTFDPQKTEIFSSLGCLFFEYLGVVVLITIWSIVLMKNMN